MKTYQKNIIAELESKRGSLPKTSPTYTRYTNMINSIKADKITTVPKTILKAAEKKSKSKKTSDNIKSYNKVTKVKEKVTYYQNKRNLVIRAKDRKGEDVYFEKKLINPNYSFGQLNNMANRAMNNINNQYKSRYSDDLVSIEEFYILERYY